MPTADRTTIKAAAQALIEALRENLVADPPTVTAPFRRVSVGKLTGTEFARPYLGVWLAKSRPIGATSDDKLMEVSIHLRVVADVVDVDSHDPLLDFVGAVDDYLDAQRDDGFIEGADGFDERSWSYEYPAGTAGARVATATAVQVFVVRVEREQNREPA